MRRRILFATGAFRSRYSAQALGVVSLLHQGNFVYGDIRGVNIMVKREWNEGDVTGNVKLIDFDWAGREGSARYPPNVNYEQVE
jgi:hypothetical protein